MPNALENLEVIDTLTSCRDELKAFNRDAVVVCSKRLKRMRIPWQWEAARLNEAHDLALQISCLLEAIPASNSKIIILRRLGPLLSRMKKR